MLVSLLLLIVILFLPQALAPNISSLSISRLFQGTAASIEGPHVAGIISDLFHRDGGRGIAMATFTLVVFTANAIGPLTCNWLASETDWANIYWMQMAMNGVVFIMCAFMLDETRHDLILDKKITKYNKTYGTDLKVQTDAAHSVKKALTTSLARPLIYLTTEPIVIALSIWVGFAWGIVFLSTGTVLHVFEKTYDFTQGLLLICKIFTFLTLPKDKEVLFSFVVSSVPSLLGSLASVRMYSTRRARTQSRISPHQRRAYTRQPSVLSSSELSN